MLSNKWYNILKFVAQLVLPGLATLYLTLGDLWGLGYKLQVAGTLTAIATFLGLFLQVSSAKYNNSDAQYDGVIEVSESDHKIVHQIKMNSDPYDLVDMSSAKFKIEKMPSLPRRSREKPSL